MPKFATLETALLAAMNRAGAPGFSLAAVQAQQIVYAQGFGVTSHVSRRPVDEHTTFAIASISKSFTATALGMLVDAGLLDWHDKVSQYLPDFALFDLFATCEMRVLDLLIHNSGLPEVSGGSIWYGSDLPRNEVVRRLRYLRPETSFRSRYAYQNVTYLVAGQLIPAVTGLSWDEFVQTRILNPLGMRDSAPNYAAARANPNMSAPHAFLPYDSGSDSVSEIAYRDHDNVGPAAAMHASAWDLAQYLRLHLGAGTYDGQTLLTPATAAFLHTPQTVVPIETSGAARPGEPHFLNYALGWRVFDFAGRRCIQHSGGVDGMRTLVTMLPEEGLAVAALCNHEVGLTRPATYALLDILLQRDGYDYFTQAFEQEEKLARESRAEEQQRLNTRQTGTKPSLPEAAFAGRYASPLVDFIEIAQEDNRLVLRFAHTPAFTAELSHWHYNTFRLDWRDPYIPWGLVTFNLDARGQVETLHLNQPSLLDVDFNELGALARDPAA